QAVVGTPEIVFAVHRKRRMPHAQLRLRGRRGVRVGALEQVERVALAADGQEHAAMLGVLLEHLEAKNTGIEVLGAFEVADRKKNMAEALQLDHDDLPVASLQTIVARAYGQAHTGFQKRFGP